MITRDEAKAAREAARAAGETIFRGNLCKKDAAHGGERYASNWKCVACARGVERDKRADPVTGELMRAAKRIENMTPERIERQRAADRKENMTPEQIEKKNAAMRIGAMTPERQSRQRAAGRIENMTPEQIEKQNAVSRAVAQDPLRVRGRLLRDAKRRADKAGVPSTLTREQLDSVWPADDKCPVFGTPFFYGERNGRQHPSAPSLDKWDAALGYAVENTTVVSWRANWLKGDSCPVELFELAQHTLAHVPGPGVQTSVVPPTAELQRGMRRLLNRSKHGAKKRGIEFALMFDELASLWPVDNRCPGRKQPFYFGPRNGRKHPDAPSVDRIDSALGYIAGNVQIVSWRLNELKRDGTPDELQKLARWVISRTTLADLI